MDPLLQYHIDARDRHARKKWPKKEADAYLPLLQERADRFAAHVASMPPDGDITRFAAVMGQRFGRYVRVHHFIADWVTAFLIVRYGEEPDPERTTDGHGWPTTFSDEDRERALQLLENKKWPAYLTLLTPPPVAATED